MIRDNPGVVRRRATGHGTPDETMPSGRFDLTITEQFARSMSVEEALEPRQPALLRDERRAAAARARLPAAPDRPGLVRRGQRQVADPHRGRSTSATPAASWRATTSRSGGAARRPDGLDVLERRATMRLKSAPAKVTRRGDRYTIMGAAWGAPVADGRGQDRRRTVDGGASSTGRAPRGTSRERLRVDVLDAAVGHAGAGRAPDHVAGVRLRRQHPATAGRPVPGEPGHLLGEQRPDHP